MIMSRFQARGYYDTTANDGRSLRIIFIHADEERTEQDVINTAVLLSEFAARCTAGEPVRHPSMFP